MILIFGGTTEGRLVVDVCEMSGKPFYYSTKTGLQHIEMHNGVHLTGPMTDTDISHFCRENNIRCIIDAAHPFAENLHSNILLSSLSTDLPVIRIERLYDCHSSAATYCKDYHDAMQLMEHDGVTTLLALSGANTIAKLKPFWQNHHTIFRILHREDSISLAKQHNISPDNIIFYDESFRLPDIQSETNTFTELKERYNIDAILTKESGTSGGFQAKVKAAIACGLKVYVVKTPDIPGSERWIKVTGRHGLRSVIQHLLPEFFPLRTGLTTGACATAAVKAAAISLINADCPEEVCFALPDGEMMNIDVEKVNITYEDNATAASKKVKQVSATVRKPDNDDPDVTKGCRITATVSKRNDDNQIRFLQGEGVGIVTLPGLGIEIGEPAINPTPRRMIEKELRQLADYGFNVKISVENGREIAKRTFNEKVGVIDGISIIGTSGIVSPFSNEAFIESIRRELKVAKAVGCSEIVMVSGMKSERILREQYANANASKEERQQSASRRYYIHYGNFIGETLKAAQDYAFTKVTLGIMIGKAVKLAEGHLDTHSHKVQMNKSFLKDIAPEYEDSINKITMARELWDIMPAAFFETLERMCYQHCSNVYTRGQLDVRIIKETR